MFNTDNLPFSISEEKYQEILQLDFLPITSSRGNLEGKTFHHLTVLGKGPGYVSPGGHKSTQWWCICDCEDHNILLAKGANLTSGNTKSCGCQNNAMRKENIKKAQMAWKVDLTGQQFGELKALEPTEARKGNSVVWKCQCSCGNIHYVASNDLNAHRIESCGCTQMSKGVRKIRNLLDQNNIPYVMEKTYPSCKFPDTNAAARFDFYINNDFLLEYDGIQHFQERDTTFFRDSLQQRQEHDQYKNQWCQDHNIPLKRIPYTELDNLSLEMIMGDKYLLWI